MLKVIIILFSYFSFSEMSHINHLPLLLFKSIGFIEKVKVNIYPLLIFDAWISASIFAGDNFVATQNGKISGYKNGKLLNDIDGARVEIGGNNTLLVYLNKGQTYTIETKANREMIVRTSILFGQNGNINSTVYERVSISQGGKSVLTTNLVNGASMEVDNDGNGTIDKRMSPFYNGPQDKLVSLDVGNQDKLATTWAELKQTRAYNPFPNPFNPEVWIPYDLAEHGNIAVNIYDQKGYLVRRIDLGETPAGNYTSKANAIHWDGRNDNGVKAASGLYFYDFIVDGKYRKQGKLVLIK